MVGAQQTLNRSMAVLGLMLTAMILLGSILLSAPRPTVAWDWHDIESLAPKAAWDWHDIESLAPKAAWDWHDIEGASVAWDWHDIEGAPAS
jgi:hypothetical protein